MGWATTGAAATEARIAPCARCVTCRRRCVMCWPGSVRQSPGRSVSSPASSPASDARATRRQVIPSALPSKATCPPHVPARCRTTASLCPQAIGAVMPGAVIVGNRSSSGHAHAPAYSPGNVAQRPIFTLDGGSGLRTGRLATTLRTAEPTCVNRRTASARRGKSAIVTTGLLDSRTDVLPYGHNDSTPVLVCQGDSPQIRSYSSAAMHDHEWYILRRNESPLFSRVGPALCCMPWRGKHGS